MHILAYMGFKICIKVGLIFSSECEKGESGSKWKMIKCVKRRAKYRLFEWHGI